MTYNGNGNGHEESQVGDTYTHVGDDAYELVKDDETFLVDSEAVRDAVDGFELGDDNDNAESPN